MPVKTVTLAVASVTERANREIAATGAYFEKLRAANPVELKVKLDRLQAIAESKIIAREMAATVRDTLKVDVDQSALAKLGEGLQKAADKAKGSGGPWWLGPALLGLPGIATLAGVAAGAVAALGAAFVAGAGAVAVFGAVAQPVLASALKAEQQVNTAQNTYTAALAAGVKPAAAYRAEQLAIGKAYADLSPAQIRLSQQLGNMAQAWQNVKASFTPLIAGSLQPWLKGITEGIGNLGSVIRPMAPVVKDLGAQFAILMGSSAFQAFARWIGTAGSAVVHSAGGAILNLIDGLMTLLPQFTPLISGVTDAMTRWSVAFARWASSQKAADLIQAFLKWFRDNGPVVSGLLLNIGRALAVLAPGLAAGGITELKLVSDFFGLIARLPPGLARPLAEVAGALLLLNKLGVISVGLKLLGIGGGAAAAGAGAAGAGLWAALLPGVRLVAGALVATVIVGMILKNISSGPGGKNWLDNPFGADPTSKDPNKQGVSTWVGLGHQIEKIWGDTWLNIRHIAEQGGTQVVITALKTVGGITGAFGLLPGFLGAPFRAAHAAIEAELAKIDGSAARHAANIKAAFELLNGLTANLYVYTNFVNIGSPPPGVFPTPTGLPPGVQPGTVQPGRRAAAFIPGAAARGPASVNVVLMVQSPGPQGSLDQAFTTWLQKSVTVRGGGSVQAAWGTGTG